MNTTTACNVRFPFPATHCIRPMNARNSRYWEVHIVRSVDAQRLFFIHLKKKIGLEDVDCFIKLPNALLYVPFVIHFW